MFSSKSLEQFICSFNLSLYIITEEENSRGGIISISIFLKCLFFPSFLVTELHSEQCLLKSLVTFYHLLCINFAYKFSYSNIYH